MSSGTIRSTDSKQSSAPSKNPFGQDTNDVREDFQTLIEDIGSSITNYCKQRPQMAGLMIFAFGFYIGWKVKPW
jgi:enamine deaminase RidA (YjgF/YER057c/UK114 family)